MTSISEGTVLTYKGKPMQRRKDVVYYGSFDEAFYIEMTITQTTRVGNMNVASNVVIELKETSKKNNVVKKAQRETLYKAIDIAEFWLRDSLGEV